MNHRPRSCRFMLGLRLPFSVVVAAVIAACSGDEVAGPPASPPPPASAQIDSVTVTQGTINVLSARVGVYAQNADSARVLFVAPGAPLDSTPSVSLAGGFGGVPVLGLRSGATYRGIVEVTGGGTRVQSDSVSFVGGELPEPLQHVSLTTSGTASRGFTIA